MHLLLLLFLFSNLSFSQKSDTSLKGLSMHTNMPTDKKITDSLLLVKYRNEVIIRNASPEDSLLTIDAILNTLGNFRIDEQKICYAPDSSFKIVTIVAEDCGAYCNSQWYSWVHFNLKDKEQIKKVDFLALIPFTNFPTINI